MFVYCMQSYGFFCNELAVRVTEYKFISIEVNPHGHASGSYISEQLLVPLSIIRGAKRVHIRSHTEINIIPSLTTIMLMEIRFPQEVIKTLSLYKDVGNAWYRVKRYLHAICWYTLGTKTFEYLLKIVSKRKWRHGSPEVNSIYSKCIYLQNNLALAYHMLVLSRKVNGKICNVDGWQLENAIETAGRALEWGGVSDNKRGKAHFRCAVALMDKAKYLVQSRATISKEEKEQASRPNAVRCYEKAALDFYYAMQVDFSGKDMVMLQTLYEQCRRKGELQEAPTAAHAHLPGIGPWYGDPRFCGLWRMDFYMVWFVPILIDSHG